jgi:sugar O-acyltransferase (sialic acid O-acetyltransferase NeuD family)
MTPLICWGATGQAKVVREALAGSEYRIVALFDNRELGSPFSDLPIYHGVAGLERWQREYTGDRPVRACVAIGGDRGRDRLDLQRMLIDRGFVALTVVHPRAFVADNAIVGIGAQVMALAAVCAGARVGEAALINTSASVDHDCIVGDGAHIGPGATLAGEVTVEDFAFVGAGAVVLPRLHIGAGATVGAGAIVTRDVAPGATVSGNPARPHSRA